MTDALDDKWRLTIETRLELVERELREVRQAVQLFIADKQQTNKELGALNSEVTQTRVTVNTLMRMAEGVMTTQAHAIETQGGAILEGQAQIRELIHRVTALEHR